MINDETSSRVISVIKYCLQHDKDQQTVIFALFLEQQSVLEVAEFLDVTPREVYTTKKAALDNLRNCEELLEILEFLAKSNP